VYLIFQEHKDKNIAKLEERKLVGKISEISKYIDGTIFSAINEW
jgi:hypothetical protein